MPKPISWLNNTAEIRTEVLNSTHSHFRTADIGRLFKLQQWAASSLMGAMPRVQYGTSYIVSSEALVEFLDEVLFADDVPALLQARRAANLYVSRRKPRTVVLKEKLGKGLASLPDGVTLTRGELRVKFETTLELGQALAILISNMAGDEEWYEFCRLYEPEQPALPSESAYEALRLGAEAKYFAERGDAPRARDYAREAAHHAHWVQVERGVITLADYDKEMEARERAESKMKEICSALTAPDAASTFSGLVSRGPPLAVFPSPVVPFPVNFDRNK
jgi:hypothetical protein